jgi:hypothetical protein
MEKCVVKLVVFNGEDFGYWKSRAHKYLLSQGYAIWEIVQEAYVIPDTLDHATQGELQMYENNYKTLNLITTALGRNVYDRIAHLEMAHNVWLKLCNTYEGSSEIKSSHRDTYNRQYQTFFLRNLESPYMIALLALSQFLAAYVHVVLLLILIMNVLNNYCMHLMILYRT